MDDKARELTPEKANKDYNAGGLLDALYGMSAMDILRAVNKLGGENKNIFLLTYAYKFSRRKTAKTLNDIELNIHARLQKAQKRLRALLLRGDY